MRFRPLIAIVMGTLFLQGCGWNVPSEIETAYENLPENIDFNYHVKPILSDKCFACHGPDKANQKAGLRLDIAENAYSALKSGAGAHAIIPGNPDESDVVDRILSKDPDVVMPPPESNLSLNKREIAVLAKWIEQGAEYKPHWSFIRPEKPELPEIESKDWPNNEIDYFIADRLEQEKWSPSKKASKETLIRRLSFDLIGLPPSLEQIEDFVQDTSDDAYEKLVDRLLASPAYGERMAAIWMDVARYADSDGYLDDKHRDFSPYRDWVIEAFNRNMSYEQFVTYQLAGDLIPEPTQESVLATAFNRLHKRNSEAGIVYEEFRQEYVADRTLTTGKAFIGLSVECARCHDHKYDPISQKDYYEMSAFFNSTNELGSATYGPGQVPGPSLLLTTEEQDKVLAYIDKGIHKNEKELSELQRPDAPELKKWMADSKGIQQSLEQNHKKGLVADYAFDRLSSKGNKQFVSPNRVANGGPAQIKEPDVKEGATGKGIFLNDFTTITLPEKVGWFEHTDPFTVSLAVHPDTEYEEAGILYHCEELRLGLKGYSMHLENNKVKFVIARSWPTNALQVKTKEAIPEKEWTDITVSYDGLGKAEGIKLYLNGKAVPVDIEIDNLYKSIEFEPDIHTYRFNGFTLGVRDKMKTFIKGGIDNLKIYGKAVSALVVLYGKDENAALEIARNPDKKENRDQLTAYYYHTEDARVQKVTDELRQLRGERTEQIDTIQEIMVMGDRPEPRPTFLLDRGMYDAPTEEVYPDIPEAVLPFDKDLPKNRLGLAKWLFDPEHPLTARVIVNRLWQQHFGKGLVASSDDFGNQGDLPSHPELLDYLALEFRDSGWDIKKMHKRIVMSATYRQSSVRTPELLEKDPANILLAHGPSYRMTAEMVRDNALAVSGLLSPKIGGASVYPYQPEGLWAEISNKPWRYEYQQEPGEGLYRRSLYTIWKRTSGPPSMQIFDVGDRGVCTVKRRETSTPLQALVLLNDPQFVEASRVLAENLISDYAGKTQDQLKKAFQLSVGRAPSSNELDVIKNFHTDEMERFSIQKEDALAYVNIGSKKLKDTSDPIQVAALATVINGMMNTADGFTIR